MSLAKITEILDTLYRCKKCSGPLFADRGCITCDPMPLYFQVMTNFTGEPPMTKRILNVHATWELTDDEDDGADIEQAVGNLAPATLDVDVEVAR